jgi:hypothetical protein
MNQKKIENKFYAAAPGKKGTMARNSEFDTDEVKNILHKESRDAEWGIDREAKGQGLYTYSAYHAYIGERVFTKRFNTRGEAEKWLEKQNAAGHPNKRKHARPGDKDEFAARLINTLKDDKSGRVAKVYRDTEYNEYVVKFYTNGTYHSKADFFTDNKDDANATASMWIQNKFSRPGTKAKFESPKNKILAELKDLLVMLKQVKADRDDIAIVSDSIKFVEKSNSSSEIGQVYRNAMDIERQYFSRPGAKAKFAWTPGAARERNYVLEVARKFDMDCAEKIETLKKALASVRNLRSIIAKTENMDELDSTRDKMYSIMRDAKMDFSRPGTKAKFAWQPEINNAIRKVNATIDNSQARLREAAKQGLWATSASICKGIGAMYSGNGGLVTLYEELQNAADKERRSK